MRLVKIILLISSFFEGFVTYPFDALLFYYLRSNMLLPEFYAKALYHLQFAVRYYSMMIFPTVVPQRIPVYFIVTATSVNCLLCLSSLIGIDYLLQQNGGHTADHISYQSYYFPLKNGSRSFLDDSINEPSNKGILWGVKLAAIILFSMFCGARGVAFRHTIVQQFKFPQERAEYIHFRVHRSTIVGLGKLIGLWSSVYGGSGGFYLRFDIVFALLASGNVLHCLTLFIGYPFVRVKTPIPQGLFRFFKALQRIFLKRAVKLFTLEEHEEIKTLFKVLPLFLPALVIISYRDQRTEMLDPEVKGSMIHPIYMSIIYPLVKMIGTVLVDGILMPHMKRKGQPLSTTTRSLAGFAFVTLSLAAATVLQIRIEKTKRSHLDEDAATVVIYNSLSCPIELKLEEVKEPFQCPPFSMIEISINGVHSWQHIRAVIDSLCHERKDRVVKVIQLKLNAVHEFLISPKSNGAIKMMELAERRFSRAFNFNSMIKIIFVSTSNLNLIVKGSHTKGYFNTFTFHIDANSNEFANLYIPPDRYLFSVLGCVLQEENIRFGAALTFMVGHSNDGRLPKTKMFVLTSPNSVSMFYQIPQIVFLGMSDVMLESPTYLFASNAVPRKWWSVVRELWYFCGGSGNLFTACFSSVGSIVRMVYRLLTGFAAGWLSILIVAQLYAAVYTIDYEHVEERGIYKSQ